MSEIRKTGAAPAGLCVGSLCSGLSVDFIGGLHGSLSYRRQPADSHGRKPGVLQQPKERALSNDDYTDDGTDEELDALAGAGLNGCHQ